MLQVPWVLGNTGEARIPIVMVRRRRITGMSVLHHASVKPICDLMQLRDLGYSLPPSSLLWPLPPHVYLNDT